MNGGAYSSAAAFAADDAVTHAEQAGADTPRPDSRRASMTPFHPGVVALADRIPQSAVVEFSKGCHTGGFFEAQEPPSLKNWPTT